MMSSVHHRLSPYEQARLDKIKRNEERLSSLGLFDAKRKLARDAASSVRHRANDGKRGGGRQQRHTGTPEKRRPTTPTRAAAAASAFAGVTPPPPPPRSSRRLKFEPPARYVSLMDDDDDVAVRFGKVEQKATKATTSHGFKCDIPADVSSSPLTEDEKAVLETKMEGDFFGKFEVRERCCCDDTTTCSNHHVVEEDDTYDPISNIFAFRANPPSLHSL